MTIMHVEAACLISIRSSYDQFQATDLKDSLQNTFLSEVTGYTGSHDCQHIHRNQSFTTAMTQDSVSCIVLE